MKSIFTSLFIFFCMTSNSQAQPAQFNYQAVARNSAGIGLANQSIKVRIRIHGTSADGPVLYSESRTVVTNAAGLFTMAIGGPGVLTRVGNLDTMSWHNGEKFLEILMDPLNGVDFVSMGTTQLLSVPFALQSENAASINMPWTGTGQAVGKVLMTDQDGTANWEGGIAFSAISASAGTTAVPNDGTAVTVPLHYENYDTGNDFLPEGSLVYPNTFSVPADGIYHFDAAVQFTGFTMENGYTFLRLVVTHPSGASTYNDNVQRASTFNQTSQLSMDLYLTAGSKVKLTVSQNTGGPGNLSAFGGQRFTGRFVMKK
jgi:hypothetical protein